MRVTDDTTQRDGHGQLHPTPVRAQRRASRTVSRAVGPTQRQDRQSEIPPGGIKLEEGAGDGLKVVREEDYQGAIAKAAGAAISDGVRVSLTISLVHEPQNCFDPNAISVRHGWDVLGYLSNGDAKAYRPVMDALAEHRLTGYCRADIWTGWDHGLHDKGQFSIRVFVDKPERQLELIARS